LTISVVTISADAMSLLIQQCILADAMAFLIQQRILCGSVGIMPCISADVTPGGDLLVVAFRQQVAFRHCVTLLVMAL
jgi:hypothetical protein